MDNEKFTLDKIDLKDADDRYWYIECQLLQIDRLKAQALIDQAEVQKLCEKARIQEALNEACRIEAEKPIFPEHLSVSCAGCGANFEYSGHDAEQMTECYDKFSYQHSNCQ